MADPATLRALLERVKTATVADRYLDAALWCALLSPEDKPSQSRPGYVPITDDDPSRWGYKETQHYTASVDDALALIERVLPGAEVLVGNVRDDRQWTANVGPRETFVAGEARLPTPALALLAALLEAKIMEAENGR